MTDFAAEQEEEVCALQAILMDDIEEVDGRGPEGLSTDAPCWQIAIRPEGVEAEDAADTPMLMSLTFAHTPKYPEEAPLLRARSVRGVANADVEELQRLLAEQAAENLGMAMVFTLSTFAREWLREKAKIEEPLDEAAVAEARRREEEAEEARREAERAAGTPVTAETYAAWWERFSAETGGVAGAEASAAAGDKGAKARLTGRRYFETRGEAAEGEADGSEASDSGEEGEEGEEDDDDEWNPDDLGSDDDDEETAEMLQQYLSKR